MPRGRTSPLTVICMFVVAATAADAETCLAPSRPFVPSDPAAAREYADLIRQDFQTYLSDIEGHLRCLDGKRTRAFAEAQEITEEYGRFVEIVRQ